MSRIIRISLSLRMVVACLAILMVLVLAGTLYKNVTQTLDWNFAAAQAVILFAGIALLLIPYLRLGRRAHG